MEQDFGNRIVVVVRNDLAGPVRGGASNGAGWQIANTIAHISAYLGNRLRERFGTGVFFVTSDGVNHPRNSQYPIIIKRAKSNEQLHNLMEKVRGADVLYHGFIREMIDHNSDDDVQMRVGKKTDSGIEYLGIGVFGPNDVVDRLTKKFGLWE